MALRDDGAAQALAGALVMAVLAGQVQLPDPLGPQGLALLAQRCQARIVGRRERLAARLQADVGSQRQQVGMVFRQRRGLLVALAAGIDATGQVQRTAGADVPGRVARCHAGHAAGRVAMALGAVLAAGAGRRAPQLLPILHPQHGRVLGVVALQRLQCRAHEGQSRAPSVVGYGRTGQQPHRTGQQPRGRGQASPGPPHHAGAMARVSRCWKPPSPDHSKASVPGPSARSQNAR